MSQKIFAGFLLLNLAFILTGCDGGDNKNKFVDYDSGIQWSETVGVDLTDRESISFCKSMNENYDIDWELPTVEQLADLVINCDDLDKCPNADDGRYSKFKDSGRFWSATIEYDTEGVLKSPIPARVYFDFDTLETGYDNETVKGKYKVRCVRTITGHKRDEQPCSALPPNSEWNSVNKITQSWSGTEWIPSTETLYSKEPSVDECRFKCKEGFVNLDNSCVEPDIFKKWSKRSLSIMSAVSAYEYCKSLEENGNTDWRLPTISEMRAIVLNCPFIEPDGNCGVTDECLDKSLCWDDSCYGCGIITDKRYSKFWDTESYFTISPNKEGWENEWNIEIDTEYYFSSTWVIDFRLGRIVSDYLKNTNYVRCTR